MKIQPSRDLVLIKADDDQTKTKSGLLVSEDWRSKPLTGEVLDTGPQVVAVKKGDRVVFERYSSLVLEDNQRLCQEKLIFGVVNA